MPVETKIQWFLHAFEQGTPALWIKRALLGALVAALAAMWFVVKFNGFSNADAMDQAQIGRQIAAGQGYSTLYARPLALYLMLARTGRVESPLPEVSQAPLGPLINAAILSAIGTNQRLPEREVVSQGDRAIALSGFAFFAASLVVFFFLARRLFDTPLALLGTGFIIATDLLWRFSFSGLPQMPMLLVFSGALLLTVQALDAQENKNRKLSVSLVLLASLLLGIMTLGHGLGLWIFAGFWIFASVAFRPRWLIAATAPFVFLLPLLPWAWHNWRVLRNPFGLPYYELWRPAGGDPLGFIADFEPLLRFRMSDFLANTGENFLLQAENIVDFFGANVVAFAFFVAVLLHTFQRWQAAQFRWAVLLMWLGAVAGMSVFGVKGAVSVNQLHVLFLPVMIFYGLAFLLVLWSRFEFNQRLLRVAFIVLLLAIVGAPQMLGLISPAKRVNWPPYLPPVIDRFADWLEPGEAMAADIPWATAWYARRVSLLLPASIEQFELIHAERVLGAPLVAIYLTPFSGHGRTYADIVNGRYREWARFILREVRKEDIEGWIVTSAVNLPVDGEAIFFADRVRWR